MVVEPVGGRRREEQKPSDIDYHFQGSTKHQGCEGFPERFQRLQQVGLPYLIEEQNETSEEEFVPGPRACSCLFQVRKSEEMKQVGEPGCRTPKPKSLSLCPTEDL